MRNNHDAIQEVFRMALKRLSPKQNQVFHLVFYPNFTIKEL